MDKPCYLLNSTLALSQSHRINITFCNEANLFTPGNSKSIVRASVSKFQPCTSCGKNEILSFIMFINFYKIRQFKRNLMIGKFSESILRNKATRSVIPHLKFGFEKVKL